MTRSFPIGSAAGTALAMADTDEETIKVLVEIPKGSRNKYEYNQESGAIELNRRVFAAVAYPTEYGFVQGTRTVEDEELDAIVAVTEPTFPGCVIPARPIAMLRMYDDDMPDHKILAVPFADPAWSGLDGVDDLPGDLADEIQHFFSVYTDLRDGDDGPRIDGWDDRATALEVIREARERYDEKGPPS